MFCASLALSIGKSEWSFAHSGHSACVIRDPYTHCIGDSWSQSQVAWWQREISMPLPDLNSNLPAHNPSHFSQLS